jgi:hypothetical protein
VQGLEGVVAGQGPDGRGPDGLQVRRRAHDQAAQAQRVRGAPPPPRRPEVVVGVAVSVVDGIVVGVVVVVVVVFAPTVVAGGGIASGNAREVAARSAALRSAPGPRPAWRRAAVLLLLLLLLRRRRPFFPGPLQLVRLPRRPPGVLRVAQSSVSPLRRQAAAAALVASRCCPFYASCAEGCGRSIIGGS